MRGRQAAAASLERASYDSVIRKPSTAMLLFAIHRTSYER